MKHVKVLLLILVTAFSVVNQASAGLFLSSDRFGYEGSWTRYGSLSDAIAGTNSIEVGLVPQRDIAFYFSTDPSDPYAPEFDILTAWYTNGGASPSNTNYGFFQYYDSDSSTVQSLNAFWNEDGTAYTVQAHGEGAGAADVARFGERAGGPASATAAFFHTLDLDFTITGLAATYNPVTGMYEDYAGNGATASINGTLSGIVQNVGSDPTRHGYYSYALNLNNNSWAYLNGYVGDDSIYAASSLVTPEPSSVMLVGVGVIASLISYGARRRKQLEPASVV